MYNDLFIFHAKFCSAIHFVHDLRHANHFHLVIQDGHAEDVSGPISSLLVYVFVEPSVLKIRQMANQKPKMDNNLCTETSYSHIKCKELQIQRCLLTTCPNILSRIIIIVLSANSLMAIARHKTIAIQT